MGSYAELAPDEDLGDIMYAGTGPATATRDYLNTYNAQIRDLLQAHPEGETVWQISGVAGPGGAGANAVFGGLNLKDWDQRQRTQFDIMPQVQGDLGSVTGLQAVAFSSAVLPGASGLPVRFVLRTSRDYLELDQAADTLLYAAMESGQFAFLQKNLRFDAPVISLNIKRDIAANLDLSMRDIGQSLSVLLSEGQIGQFEMSGRSYQIVPLVSQEQRQDINALSQYYLRSSSGELVPLSTVVDIEQDLQAEFLPQFQQQNSVTIEGVINPHVTLGEALETLAGISESQLSRDFEVDYAGQSRQLMQQGNTVVVTFALSMVLIYLLLVAQFGSFRDPLVVLVAVPMSVFGALVFIYFGVTTINIYTQVGLITLIGLITKQSILVVEFANVLRRTEGLDITGAVKRSASIRLRPIIMTTAAMVFGVLPLILATGPGASSRFAIGVVLGTGVSIGALISLYVVPVVYTLLASDKLANPTQAA